MINENKLLTFAPLNDLVYDIDEIEHPMYMFSHECVGCVVLTLSNEISKTGKVYLDNMEYSSWRLIRTNNFSHQLLVVKLRGILREYNTKVDLRIEDFVDMAGKQMEPQSFKIKVLPRRNEYLERYKAHNDLALQAACESMVLLKNDGTLPLNPNSRLALFGEGVHQFRICPTGAGRINPRTRRNLIQAIVETSDFSYDSEVAEFYAIPNNHTPDIELLRKSANENDVAVIVITRGTGENIDNRPIKGEYYLTDEEETLIENVSNEFKKCIVILNVSYPIDVRFLNNKNINACIYTGLGGMCATEALMMLLDGRATPCGHLPNTWSKDYFDAPASINFLNYTETDYPYQTDDPVWARVCYEEGLYVGYRFFSSFDKNVVFPFGFGLSYTSFKNDIVSLNREKDKVTFKIDVQNVGETNGKEVVQVYVSKPSDVLENPTYELIAFGKTKELSPNETEELALYADFCNLTSYDEKTASWKLLKGDYKFYYGENVNALSYIGAVTFSEEKIVKKVKNRVCPKIKINEFTRENQSVSRRNTGIFEKSPFAPVTIENEVVDLPPIPDKTIYFEDVLENPERALEFATQLTDEELCRFNVCKHPGWNMESKGEAGWTVGIERLNLPSFALADGNNGVNLFKPNIGMPTSAMIAASFDTELAYKVGCAIAEEALENDVSILLGPAMNLHRNIFGGRNSEYFSEDPYLAGIIAGWQNKGFQDKGVCGCIKHVAANNCESLRKRSDSVMTERTLREMYIRPFEYSMQVEPSDTIMTGYNALNGVFCDENPELIEGIFREELGFDGFAMSDWNSYDTSDMSNMVKAGISFLTPGCNDDFRVKPLREALNTGVITREIFVRNAARIVKTMANRINKR